MSTESRLKRLETVTERMLRHVPRHVTVASAPFPVSMFCAEATDGVAGRYMFPCDGIISRACILIANAADAVQVTATLRKLRTQDSMAQSFSVPKRGMVQDLEIFVEVGDQLEISVPPGTCNIWVALLWKPALRDHVLKTFALEEIERAAEEVEP